MAGRTGYPLQRSRLPLPGVSPSRPQRQRTANRDWNRCRKDAGPWCGSRGDERSLYPLHLQGVRSFGAAGAAITVKPGRAGAAVIPR